MYRIRPLPRIYVLSGPELGRTFDVAAGATFGRAAECAVPLHDASVSRAHARLEHTATGWRVVDVGSRNGLFVGRERVPASDLADGDEFRLGEVLLRFRDERAAPVIAPDSLPRAAAEVPAGSAPEMHFRPMGHSTRSSEEAGGEIELEGDWSAPAPAARAAREPSASAAPSTPVEASRAAPVAAPRSAAVDARARKMAAAGLAPAVRSTDARGVLQYSKVEQREGLLKQDFGQQPTWLRALVVVLLIAAAVGLGWVAYRAANAAKAQIAPPDTVEDGSDR